MFSFAYQDCKIQGTSAQSLWKAVQRSSGLIKANSTAALQRWSGNRVTSATSDCMGCSCATEERSRGCTGGNLNTEFRRSEEERCHQPSPKKARSQSSPAKPKDDVTSEGPTIADLTAIVLENRHLENQLAERKIEVEELRDDLRLLRRGLSSKMKRLFEATVTRTSIRSHFLRKVVIIV